MEKRAGEIEQDEEALRYLERGAQIAEQIEDAFSQADALRSLATTAAGLNNWALAYTIINDISASFRAVGDASFLRSRSNKDQNIER